MSFTSERQQAPLTNVEEKEEKIALQREHSELKLKIKEAQAQVNKQKDLSGEIVQKQTKVAEINAFLNELVGNLKDRKYDLKTHSDLLDKKKKEVLMLENTIKDKLQELDSSKFAFADLESQQKGSERKLEVALEGLENSKGLIAQLKDIATKFEADNIVLEEKNAELTTIKFGYESSLKDLQEQIVGAKTQLDTHLGAIDKAQNAVKEHELAIEEAKKNAEEVLEAAREQAKHIIALAQVEIQKRHSDLDDRESSIALREGWNKEKIEKMKEIKMELEKHLGKPIQINFA